MGASAFVQAAPVDVPPGGPWTRTDGKDFATVLSAPRCRELLEEHAGADLAAALVPDRWHPLDRTVDALDALLAALPAGDSAGWSEGDAERFGYLFAELAGEVDGEYFDEGFFAQDLRDLRAAVAEAGAAGAERVRLFVA